MSDNPTGCENFTRTPNAIFDTYLAAITSLCELKVVMAIVRKTYGWQKEQDSISLSQLEDITGLSREGVIQGVKKACKRGLVVRKASGQGYVYQLKMPVVTETSSIKEEATSQRFRPATSQPSGLPSQQYGLEVVNDLDQQLVNDLDPQKKGLNKLKENNSMAQANVPASTRDYVPEITPETSSSMPPARKEKELPRRPVVTEADKIADYFARKINSDKDSLTRSEYIAINQLISEGFNLERCIPGIDDAVNGIRGRGQVVSSFLACPRSIRQLDPKSPQPAQIQNYQKPAPFEQAKKPFREEDYQLTPAQAERNRRKKEEDAAWVAADRAAREKARLGQQYQLQA